MKISVITVCKNSGSTIEGTIRSVIGQSHPDIEYIIIDGKSEDSTLGIIEKYRDQIDVVISESDSGIYDAMNRGIDIASGDYLFFLNSDDRFLHDKVVDLAVKAFSPKYPEVIYGDMIFLNVNSGSVSIRLQNKINKIYVYKNSPSQPTVFYKRNVFDKCGRFKTEYSIVSDFEWMLNAILRKNVSLQYINVALTLFSSGGVSSSRRNEIHDIERSRVYSEYFSQYELTVFPFISRYLRSLTTIPFISSLLNMFLNFELKNEYTVSR